MTLYANGDAEMYWVRHEQISLASKVLHQAVFKSALKNQKIYRIKSEKEEEHEAEVNFITMNESNGCYMTGSKDGVVKVWNKEKKLLSEFEFYDEPRAAIFKDNKFGVYIAHSTCLSEILNTEFKEAVA